MYYLVNIERWLCRIVRDFYGVIMDGCEIFSVWRFCSKEHLFNMQQFMASDSMCGPNTFPIIFWLTYLISFLGAVRAIREFWSLFTASDCKLSTWQTREYYVISKPLLLRVRMFFSLVMSFNFILLIFGLSTVSPTYMTPWIFVTATTLILEFVQLPLKLFYRNTKLELQHALTYILPIMHLLFVRCIHNVFVRGIATGDIEGLLVLPGFT